MAKSGAAVAKKDKVQECIELTEADIRCAWDIYVDLKTFPDPTTLNAGPLLSMISELADSIRHALKEYGPTATTAAPMAISLINDTLLPFHNEWSREQSSMLDEDPLLVNTTVHKDGFSESRKKLKNLMDAAAATVYSLACAGANGRSPGKTDCA